MCVPETCSWVQWLPESAKAGMNTKVNSVEDPQPSLYNRDKLLQYPQCMPIWHCIAIWGGY